MSGLSLSGSGLTITQAGGGSQAPVATTITAAGVTSYSIPTGAVWLLVTLWSGGGGGGGGRRGAVGSSRLGGIGGGAGVPVSAMFLVSSLTSPVSVTVGNGGAAGAAATANDTNGGDGVAGADTTFGTYLRCLGGTKGYGGTNSAFASAATGQGTAGGTLLAVQLSGRQYAAGSTTNSAIGTTPTVLNNTPGNGGGVGGTGGSVSSANVEQLGIQATWATFADPNVAAPSGPAVAGAAGAAGVDSALPGFAGNGGGSGGPSASAAGGGGGAGGRGSGGGGGGASVNGFNSGAGGAGGNGMAYIVAYFS